MSEPARRRALIVEDEAPLRELLRLHLDLAGFQLLEAADGLQGLASARSTPFDLILLDVMLPGLDGVSVCRAIRASGPNTAAPILMLTARDGESDMVLGLESGADDYVTKPFGVRELMARIGAITRRQQRVLQPEISTTGLLVSGDITLDPSRRQLTIRGSAIELTKQEFDLLYLLMSKRGIVFSRAALLRKVWSDDAYVTERTVDAVISRLRRKVERDSQDPELLLTVWGSGYKFADAES